MAEDVQAAPLDRIDKALGRIEAAVTRHRHASETLSQRHAALRARVAEAVSALDDVIAKRGGG